MAPQLTYPLDNMAVGEAFRCMFTAFKDFDRMAIALETQDLYMSGYYDSFDLDSLRLSAENIKIGNVCVARSTNDCFERAVITFVEPDGVTVLPLDGGRVKKLPAAKLLPFHSEMTEIPTSVDMVSIHGIELNNVGFFAGRDLVQESPTAARMVHELINNLIARRTRLTAVFLGKIPHGMSGLSLVDFVVAESGVDAGQPHYLSDYLVQLGCAVRTAATHPSRPSIASALAAVASVVANEPGTPELATPVKAETTVVKQRKCNAEDMVIPPVTTAAGDLSSEKPSKYEQEIFGVLYAELERARELLYAGQKGEARALFAKIFDDISAHFDNERYRPAADILIKIHADHFAT